MTAIAMGLLLRSEHGKKGSRTVSHDGLGDRTVLKVPLYPEERSAEHAKVCVTGATGFLAGHVIERLLAIGHTVHGTVRDLRNLELLEDLRALPGASDRLKLFEADLQKPGSFSPALQGCNADATLDLLEIMNSQAPPITSDLLLHDMVRSVAMTRCRAYVDYNLLWDQSIGAESVNQSGSVQRVVLTSACAAMYSDCYQKGRGVAFTEDDWAHSASENRLPVHYAKRRAEEVARSIAESQCRWDLVTINSALAIGPPIGKRRDGETLSFVSQLFSGKFERSPRISLGMVDIRDAAAAHCLAMVHPKAQGRYICCEGTYSVFQCGEFIKEKYPKQKVPKQVVPSWVLSMPGVALLGVRRDFMNAHVEKVPIFDTSKIQRDLAFEFRPCKFAYQEMIDRMCELELLQPLP